MRVSTSSELQEQAEKCLLAAQRAVQPEVERAYLDLMGGLIELAALMAQLPAGTLMQRAAAGLAAVCADLLRASPGGVYGARVVILTGTGDNGGDALYAGERLARRDAGTQWALTHHDRAAPAVERPVVRDGTLLAVDEHP